MTRPMTVAEKILAAHAGLDEVRPGQLVECDLDIVLANDITAPIAIDVFRELGAQRVFDRDRVCLVPDHYAPNKDIKSATQSKQCREFANKYDILNFYDVGQMGVAVCGLRELVVMFGEMRDFRPIVGFGEFVRALVRLPPSDDVEGNVDSSLQPSGEIVCGASVAHQCDGTHVWRHGLIMVEFDVSGHASHLSAGCLSDLLPVCRRIRIAGTAHTKTCLPHDFREGTFR